MAASQVLYSVSVTFLTKNSASRSLAGINATGSGRAAWNFWIFSCHIKISLVHQFGLYFGTVFKSCACSNRSSGATLSHSMVRLIGAWFDGKLIWFNI